MDRAFAVVLVALTVAAMVLVSIQPEPAPTREALPRVGQGRPPAIDNPVVVVARYTRARFTWAARVVEDLHRGGW